MTKIAFTGDVAFTRYFSDSCFKEDLLDKKVENFLSDADYTVVNVEGAISTAEGRSDKSIIHANPADCIHPIKKMNGNIWNLANNHIMDCGDDGMRSTLDIARENNVQTIGVGENINEAAKPVIIDKDGGIAIISVTNSTHAVSDEKTPGCLMWNYDDRIKAEIEELKSKYRWCIVLCHAGAEFSHVPMPFVRKRYRNYIKYGADAVISHHPHVVQGYEKVCDKIIFYSLGNFIFDTDFQRIQKFTDTGMLIKLEFTETTMSWENLPIHINRENHTVEEGKNPAIFRNLSPFQYALLWPLAAKGLCLNERKKRVFLKKEKFGSYTKWDWFFKYDLDKMKKVAGRHTMAGRILAFFRLWKLADKELVNYVIESFR